MDIRLTAMVLVVASLAGAAGPAFAQASGSAGGATSSADRQDARLLGRPAPGYPPPERRAYRNTDPSELRREVLEEANRARRRAGSPALVPDDALARAATSYSRELAQRREIAHVSRTPGRRTFRDRIAAAGAEARVAGENLARLTAAPEHLARRVVRAWLRSPGHRSNLLDPAFRRTGIGIMLGADGIWYITQYYATPS